MNTNVVTKLFEVLRAVSLEPLEPTDKRYTDLSKARNTRELLKLRTHLENCANNERRACAAFIGHRGSGKTTELKRLEGELGSLYTSLHLEVDQSLQLDCDYTDLLLWLVDSIVTYFNEKSLPLDGSKVKDVVNWFAERTIETAEAVKTEVELETKAEVSSKTGANLGLLAYSLKLLARIKARVVGNREHRKVSRQKLQYYSDELIQRVNKLLAHARDTLAANNRPSRLLVVQDNLDRLGREAALRLFCDNGSILKRIDTDCIWTVPINSRLAPFGIHNLFDEVFSMPIIKVHDRSGKDVEAGITGLMELVSKRIDVPAVFDSPDVVTYLVKMSGGSVRDLLRLLGEAQLAAQVDELQKISLESAKEAAKKLRLDFQGLFVPGDVYYPILAAVARTKQDATLTASATPDQATSNRAFFAELLVNGSILEYNGDERWFDVHPVVREIKVFCDVCKATKSKKASRKKT
jgi:hypothetical protein